MGLVRLKLDSSHATIIGDDSDREFVGTHRERERAWEEEGESSGFVTLGEVEVPCAWKLRSSELSKVKR